MDRVATIVIQIVVLVFSVILHEVAHGYAAWRLGDPTARMARRMTLNPLAHIDPFGSVLLPLLLAVTHSPVLFGWAKPVPVNPGYFRDPRRGMMIVGAAGPLTNLLIAAVAAAVYRLAGMPEGLIGGFLVYGCVINIFLALFNALPIPPLDGSRVALGLMPDQWVGPYLKLERFGFLIIFALLWLGLTDYLVVPLFRIIIRVLLP
jgi:Zn-dependent protease